MNYPQTLNKAKTLLRQRHYAQAVQTAASALENVMLDLYQEVLNHSSPGRQKELIEVVERVGGDLPLHKLTLGKLLGVYRMARLWQDLEETLGLSLTYLNINALSPLVESRNRAVHDGHEPDEAEATYIVNQVALILRETGRVPRAQPVTSGDGEVSPWWQHAMPHRDIREGRLDLKVFAVDLAQVLEGNAVPEYQDAETYFRYTYPTRGLQSVLAGVLRQLAGRDDGVAITQLATVFGGGKTHTLLGLYHTIAHGSAVQDLDVVRHLLNEAELGSVPEARVAAVDGRRLSASEPRTTADGVTLHTLWGELAYRLGARDGRGAEFYEILRSSDEQRAAPGSEALERLFQATGPALILIDETLSYITKASAVRAGHGYLSDQALEFLLELTSAVVSADQVALVLTMTASEEEQFGDEAIRAAREVDSAIRVLRRTRQVEVSAEREELYEILKRRLFDGDPATREDQARGVANAYWNYYRQHPNDFPQHVQAPEYRNLMRRAYPFHPALIEILRDRWGSIQGFQRTRGVLRLLALIIGDLYRRQHSAPTIQPAHVNLENGQIRAELLEYVDNRGGYEAAVFSDIGGTDESKAPHLDRTTAGDYARFSICTGLATSIFLYSHSGATDRTPAAGRPELWTATLRPGVMPALAVDGLDKLKKRLWYLAVQEGMYRIDSQPNLNQMLVSRIDAIRQEPESIEERVRAAVSEMEGRGLFDKVVVWPGSPRDVDDNRSLKLVIGDLERTWGNGDAGQKKARAFVQDVLANAKSTFRQYKNTLVFLLPTNEGVNLMRQAAVRLLALEGIHRQYRSGGLSQTQMEELKDQLDKARKGLPAAVWGAYTVLVAPNGAADGQTSLWVKQEHGISGYRPGDHTLSNRVWERLQADQRLLERLDPRLISEGKGDQWRLWAEDDDRLAVSTLWDYFCRFPYLPMLSGPEALQQTLSWGVQRGLFAYALGDGESFDTIRFQETLSSMDFAISEGAWLLRTELAEELLEPEDEGEDDEDDEDDERTATTGGDGEEGGDDDEKEGDGDDGGRSRTIYHRLSVDTPLKWQDWYDFYQSVIQPLVAEAGADVDLRLHLEARGEMDVNLIDLSVKESVVQYNREAQVEAE
ncbi:MAG: ATP-binding protein [Chloroflexota bacterium]